MDVWQAIGIHPVTTRDDGLAAVLAASICSLVLFCWLELKPR
jgi:hypothetical protein